MRLDQDSKKIYKEWMRGGGGQVKKKVYPPPPHQPTPFHKFNCKVTKMKR